MRKLKYHEQKLLKKINYSKLKRKGGHRVASVMQRYHVTVRDDYKQYSNICETTTKLVNIQKQLDPKDPFRVEITDSLLQKLTPAAAPAWDDTVDGKRSLSYQMEKNSGLTRSRNRKAKSPRRNYKKKHEKAEIKHQGRIPAIKKPCGPYGGEASGINTQISQSIRF